MTYKLLENIEEKNIDIGELHKPLQVKFLFSDYYLTILIVLVLYSSFFLVQVMKIIQFW